MNIQSPSFENGKEIPSKYTCDGEGINPSLIIGDVPIEAKSLVLLMDDPDIPDSAKQSFGIEVWDHWVVFNMPPDVKEIKENSTPPGVLGKNTRGNMAYGSPCPPDREHRYFFKLYALDSMLNLAEGAMKQEVIDAMQGYILAEAELMGRYNRK